MNVDYWKQTPHPAELPISERESWHRDAWDREQTELMFLTDAAAGNDAPRSRRNFGFSDRGTAL